MRIKCMAFLGHCAEERRKEVWDFVIEQLQELF
jgi:hypothetical protein